MKLDPGALPRTQEDRHQRVPPSVSPVAQQPVAQQLLASARELSQTLAALRFAPPVTHVYDPLQYAWAPYEAYVSRFGATRKRVVLLGMNPGPFGMMQTGVPFGEVAAVRDWMGLRAPVERPPSEHPKRPIAGFECTRSEVSGRRLWGWAALRFGPADAFFDEWFVLNYCPLVFLEASGRNFTPDKLPVDERRAVLQACNRHLAAALGALQPVWAIGVGGFAERCLRSVLEGDEVESALARRIKVAQILHPSPASPAANRGWIEAVDRTLAQLGVPLRAATG
jgi:single-strand selective monofunctional uracil DNA glycosylase